MKAFLFTCGILVSLFPANHQQPRQDPIPSKLSFEYEKQCGNPEVESMLWRLIEGTVVGIVDGDSIKLLTSNREKKIVNLVAIDASPAKDGARSLLSRLVLNRKVQVLVNPSNSEAHTLVGVVEVDGKDVNSELLEGGLARYRVPPHYSVSNYTACSYRIVEKKAREAMQGMWRRSNQ